MKQIARFIAGRDPLRAPLKERVDLRSLLATGLAIAGGILLGRPASLAEVPSRVPALSETTVTASSRQLNVGIGETVTLTTHLPVQANETIVIKDMAGKVVRTLVNDYRPPGTYQDGWDGMADGGRRLRDEQYRWVASFEDGRGCFQIDLSNQLDGDFEVKSHPEYPEYDPFNNKPLKISVSFDRPGQVFLVFSRRTYYVPLSCTPPDYFCRFLDGYQPSGPFSYEWAGVDDTGALRPDIHGILVVSNHEHLSRNAIVVYGGAPTIHDLHVSPALYSPGAGLQTATFTLATYHTERVSATVSWENESSHSVLRVASQDGLRSGPVEFSWNGFSDTGIPVAPGSYTIDVITTDSLGQRAERQILARISY